MVIKAENFKSKMVTIDICKRAIASLNGRNTFCSKTWATRHVASEALDLLLGDDGWGLSSYAMASVRSRVSRLLNKEEDTTGLVRNVAHGRGARWTLVTQEQIDREGTERAERDTVDERILAFCAKAGFVPDLYGNVRLSRAEFVKLMDHYKR